MLPPSHAQGASYSGSILPPTLLRVLADACAPQPPQGPQSRQQQQQQQLRQVTRKLLQGMLRPLGGCMLQDERQVRQQGRSRWDGRVSALPPPFARVVLFSYFC